MHSFLLIGQSNAGGRGFPNEVEPIINDKIFVLRNGRWRPMYVPVNPDRVKSGICFAESFADLYAIEHNVEVGIIPCADGGTCLDLWCEGSELFDHACYMSELASRTSTIVGVLWHQGESDCHEDRYPLYEKKLTTIIDKFRDKLNLNDVPFLLGGLGDFLKDCDRGEHYKNYLYINSQLNNISQKNKMIGFVSAEGLLPNADNLHFSAQSLREFGMRYYNEFKKFENQTKIIENKCKYNIENNDIELL